MSTSSGKSNNEASLRANKLKSNGFLVFLLEYRRKNKNLEMLDAQKEAGKLWEKMDANHREKYNQMSLRSNDSRSKPVTKYTSTGESFESVEHRVQNQRKAAKSMELSIEEMLQTAFYNNQLESKTFYFFSASYFAQTLKGDIYPAEIAMSKFSLAKGVYDTLHMMVNPGQLPLGSAANAKSHSEQTHKRRLPPDPNPHPYDDSYKHPPEIEGEKDYSVMMAKILDFLNIVNVTRSTYPPIFVGPGHNDEDVRVAKATLDKISNLGCDHNIEFRVYPIEQLLFRLQKLCIGLTLDTSHTPFVSIISAKNAMSRDDKWADMDIGCKFHQEEDANHECCLSKVKRWGYTIVSHCLDDTAELPKLPGLHIPKGHSYISSKPSTLSDFEWESEVSESLSRFRIDSHMSLPKKVATASKSSSLTSVNSTASFATSKDFKQIFISPSFDDLSSASAMSTNPQTLSAQSSVLSVQSSKSSVQPSLSQMMRKNYKK